MIAVSSNNKEQAVLPSVVEFQNNDIPPRPYKFQKPLGGQQFLRWRKTSGLLTATRPARPKHTFEFLLLLFTTIVTLGGCSEVASPESNEAFESSQPLQTGQSFRTFVSTDIVPLETSGLIDKLTSPGESQYAVRELVRRGAPSVAPLVKVLTTSFDELPRISEQRRLAVVALGDLGTTALPALNEARDRQKKIVGKRDHALKFQYRSTNTDWLVAHFGRDASEECTILADIESAYWLARHTVLLENVAKGLANPKLQIHSPMETRHSASLLPGKLMIVFVNDGGRYVDTDRLDEIVSQFAELRTGHRDWKLLIVNLVEGFHYRLPTELVADGGDPDWCLRLDAPPGSKTGIISDKDRELGGSLRNVVFWLKDSRVISGSCATPEARDWLELRIDREQDTLKWNNEAEKLLGKLMQVVAEDKPVVDNPKARELATRLVELDCSRSAVIRIGERLDSWIAIRNRMAIGLTFECAVLDAERDLRNPLLALQYFENEPRDVALELIRELRARCHQKDRLNDNWHADRIASLLRSGESRSARLARLYNEAQEKDCSSTFTDSNPDFLNTLSNFLLSRLISKHPGSIKLLDAACDYNSKRVREKIAWTLAEVGQDHPSCTQILIRRMGTSSVCADALFWMDNPGSTVVPAIRGHIRSCLKNRDATDDLIAASQLLERLHSTFTLGADAAPELVSILESDRNLPSELEAAACEALSAFGDRSGPILPRLRTLYKQRGKRDEWLRNLIENIEHSVDRYERISSGKESIEIRKRYERFIRPEKSTSNAN